MEGVRAVVEHSLRVSVGVGGGLDAQVSEHSVRLPATKELDSVRIYAGAEEGSGAAGSQRAGADESGRDAGGGFEGSGGDT